MRLKGIIFAFLYCPPDGQSQFNYWYDTDHLPENRALPGIFHAQRYVSPTGYLAYREVDDLEGGAGNYMTAYFTENEPRETVENMGRLLQRLRGERRMTRFGRLLFNGIFRPETVLKRPGFLLESDAVPLMPHLGAYLTLDEVYNKDGEQRLIDWYDNVYIPDTLGCHGVAAVVRFHCLSPGYEGRVLHYFFLDGDPISVAAEKRQRLATLREQGRILDFSGLARQLFAGPYRAIVPFQYDFVTS